MDELALKDCFERLDVLVCAQCLSVFHQIQEFSCHRSGCTGDRSNASDVVNHNPRDVPLAIALRSNSLRKTSEDQCDRAWASLNREEQKVWMMAAKSLRCLKETEKVIFRDQEETRSKSKEIHLPTVDQLTEVMESKILVPVISKSSKRVKRKFRGLDGKFATNKSGNSKMSSSKSKVSKISSGLQPELEERTKRKSLIEAINRVKLWTNEKSENIRNLKQNQISERDKSQQKKRVRQKCIEEIILGGSGPLTLLQAAKDRNMLGTRLKQICKGHPQVESTNSPLTYSSTCHSGLTIVPLEDSPSSQTKLNEKSVETFEGGDNSKITKATGTISQAMTRHLKNDTFSEMRHLRFDKTSFERLRHSPSEIRKKISRVDDKTSCEDDRFLAEQSKSLNVVQLPNMTEGIPSTSSKSFCNLALGGNPVRIRLAPSPQPLEEREPEQNSADANLQNLQVTSEQHQSNDEAGKIIQLSCSTPHSERDLQPLHLSQVEPGGFVTIPIIVPDSVASSTTEIPSASSQVFLVLPDGQMVLTDLTDEQCSELRIPGNTRMPDTHNSRFTNKVSSASIEDKLLVLGPETI